MFRPTNIFRNFFKSSSQIELNKLESAVKKINVFEAKLKDASSDFFPEKTLPKRCVFSPILLSRFCVVFRVVIFGLS